MKRTVLITGGAGGIGSACARRLSADYNIILAYNQNKAGAERLCRELADACQIIPACGDITDSGFVRSLFSVRVDAVVNNAGISCFSLAQDMTDELLEQVLAVDLKSCCYVCREAMKKMSARGGSIVNISSMWGQVGAAGESAYSAAKAGVIGLTKALAKEGGPMGIRVNCICPGMIDTPMNDLLSDPDRERIRQATPLGRIGRPEDVAGAAAFLLGDEASFITGQILGVNGGLVI